MSWPTILTGGQVTVNKASMEVVEMVGPMGGTTDEGFTSLALGPDMVGPNIRMPGDYDLAQRKQPVTTRRQFPYYMVAESGPNDETRAAFEGVWQNIAYLRQHVFDQPSISDRPDGTREVVFETPDGTEYEADVHFHQPRITQPRPDGWLLIVEFDIVRGSFLAVAS